MEDGLILKILNNNELTEEEKIAFLRKLAEETMTKSSIDKGVKTVDKSNDLDEEYVVITQRENMFPSASKFYVKPEVIKKSDIMNRVKSDTDEAVAYFEQYLKRGKEVARAEEETFGPNFANIEYGDYDGTLDMRISAGLAIKKSEYERIQQNFKIIETDNEQKDKEIAYLLCDDNVFTGFDPNSVIYGIAKLEPTNTNSYLYIEGIEKRIPLAQKSFWVDYNAFYEQLKNKEQLIGADIDVTFWNEDQDTFGYRDPIDKDRNKAYIYSKDYGKDYFKLVYEMMFINSTCKKEKGLNPNTPFCDMFITATNYKKYFSNQEIIDEINSFRDWYSYIEPVETDVLRWLKENHCHKEIDDINEIVDIIKGKEQPYYDQLVDKIMENPDNLNIIREHDWKEDSGYEAVDAFVKMVNDYDHEYGPNFCTMIFDEVIKKSKELESKNSRK